MPLSDLVHTPPITLGQTIREVGDHRVVITVQNGRGFPPDLPRSISPVCPRKPAMGRVYRL